MEPKNISRSVTHAYHHHKINNNEYANVDYMRKKERINSSTYQATSVQYSKPVSVPEKKCYFVYIKPVVLDNFEIVSGGNTIEN